MRIVLRASVTTLPKEKFWLHEEFPKDWKLYYTYLQRTGTVITFLLPRFVLTQIYLYYYYFLLLQAVSYWYFSSWTSSGPLAEASSYLLQYLPYFVWCS